MIGASPLPAVFLTRIPTSLPGTLLSLFLGPDGGLREGAIRLPPEKVTDTAYPTIPEEESFPSSLVATILPEASLYNGLRKASCTFPGVFASRVPEPTSPKPVSYVPASPQIVLSLAQTDTRMAMAVVGEPSASARDMTAITGDGGPHAL